MVVRIEDLAIRLPPSRGSAQILLEKLELTRSGFDARRAALTTEIKRAEQKLAVLDAKESMIERARFRIEARQQRAQLAGFEAALRKDRGDFIHRRASRPARLNVNFTIEPDTKQGKGQTQHKSPTPVQDENRTSDIGFLIDSIGSITREAFSRIKPKSRETIIIDAAPTRSQSDNLKWTRAADRARGREW